MVVRVMCTCRKDHVEVDCRRHDALRLGCAGDQQGRTFKGGVAWCGMNACWGVGQRAALDFSLNVGLGGNDEVGRTPP